MPLLEQGNKSLDLVIMFWTVKKQQILLSYCIFWSVSKPLESLTHWGQVTHICISRLIIIASDNGLSPGRCQAIIWTNAEILLIGPLGANFSEIPIKI